MIKFFMLLAVGLIAGVTLGLFINDNPKTRIAAFILAACAVLGVLGLWIFLVVFAIEG